MIIIVPTMNGYSQKFSRAYTIELNGIQTYYEVYGHGDPLFLLHGFNQSSQSWSQFIPEYYNEYEIYLVDLMGHGKSSAFVEEVSVRSAAENLMDLIEYLGLENSSMD
jgi:pimeloyl-ACP methyl ester carboxylesterase